jgi:tetratricopeptide (TPR) repeat protein
MGVEIRGRDEELEQLGRIVTDAVAGQGRLVFLTSPTGGGKSTLIAALRERVDRGDLGELEALRFVCMPSTPYGPFLELLSDLTGRDRKRILAARARSIVTATAPLVLKAIPAVGELAAAGFTELMKMAESGPSMDAVSTQIADALERIAADESPLLVILDEAHQIDDGSCEVVRRFVAEGVPDRLVLLLAFDPQRLPDGHPLRQIHSDAMLAGQGVDVQLEPLDESDVAEMMRPRWGGEPHPLLAAWLVERCGGNAAFVVAFLRALEDTQVVRRDADGVELDGTLERGPDGWVIGGALAGAVVPASLKQLAELQAAVLPADERTLLQEASIQGEQFAARVLVEMLGADEDDVRRRLTPLTERRLITYDDDVWWNERSVVWRFDPRVLQSAFYDAATQSEYDRRQLHRRVADVLEQIVADDALPPGRILLQLARHRQQAGQSVAAASWLLRAAQAAAAAGSWRGAFQLCRDALDLLETADDDRLRAEATGLLLLAAAWFWDDKAAHEEATLRALATSGEQAARRLGEPGPLARFLYGRGLLAYVAEGYPEAIRLLREADELAEQDFDVVGRVLLLTRLGHALDSGEGLGAGLETLERARKLLDGADASAALDSAEATRARGLLSRDIGVALYDLGDYAAAAPHLQKAVTSLAGAGPEDEAWALSFRAQLEAALGRREEARASLEAALSGLHPGPQTTRALLLGMRARLALEAGDSAQAAQDIDVALRETSVAPDVTATALVRILFAEVAIGLSRFDEVAAQLDQAATESHGAARVVVGVHTTRARLELARGDPAAAAESAELALAQLAACDGAVPFFRSDEVLWWCAQAQTAAGKDAGKTIALARAAVERRAAGLEAEDERAYRATPVAAGIASFPVAPLERGRRRSSAQPRAR